MWAVTMMFDLDGDIETLGRWEDALEDFDGTVSRVPGEGVMVVAYATGRDPLKAAMSVREVVTRVLGRQPYSVEVVSEQVHVKRADAPTLPELVSAPEVAEMLGGISRQRVHQLRATASFPQPLYELRTGPIWDARAIRHFAEHWERKPGRRAAG